MTEPTASRTEPASAAVDTPGPVSVGDRIRAAWTFGRDVQRRFAADLAHRLDDVVHPPHVPLRQQAAVGVRRQLVAVPQPAVAYSTPPASTQALSLGIAR